MRNKLKMTLVALMAAFLLLPISPAFAAKGDQGPDWAKYQGTTGRFGYATDKFAIAQIGGSYGGTYIDQLTYSGQIQSGLSRGLRMHTYLWYGVGGSIDLGAKAMDYYLPKIQTPKGSIIALDYEDGASGSVAANTDAILYGMRRIARAGYTPMYYSYKPYTLAHVDYKRIIAEFPNSLWIAAYPNYLVTPKPNYGYFPSMDGVSLFQFTSTYIAGGLDGNVDLTGITDNGYSKQPTAPGVPQPDNGYTTGNRSLEDMATDTLVGRVGNEPIRAQRLGQYATSVQTIVNERVGAITGTQSHQALAKEVLAGHLNIGTQRQYLLGSYYNAVQGIINGSLSTRSYTIQYGDSFWSIANKLGVNMNRLAARNGKSINSIIYPGQTLTY